eukprot:11125428-Heterocapsa_arctica.AAC.1
MLPMTPPTLRAAFLERFTKEPSLPAAASLPSRVLPPALARRPRVAAARRRSRSSQFTSAGRLYASSGTSRS